MKKSSKQTKNYLVKTIKAYSSKLTDEQSSKLDNLFISYGRCRGRFFNEYCGINNMIKVDSYRKIRDHIRKAGLNKKLVKQYNFLNKHWIYALFDTCSNVKTMWTNLSNQVKHCAISNNQLNNNERHFINFCLSIKPIWFAILQHNQDKTSLVSKSYQDHYHKLAGKLSKQELKHAFSYICRLTRRYKAKPHKVNLHNKSMTYDENMYNFVDPTHFKFSSNKSKKSFIVKLTSDWHYRTKGNLTLVLDRNKRRLEVHKVINTHKHTSLVKNNVLGVDKGLYTLLSASSGCEYGINYSGKIRTKQDSLAKKLADRNPYYGKRYELSLKITKLANKSNKRNVIKRKKYEKELANLQKHNLGHKRYFNQYTRVKAYFNSMISHAVYTMFETEKPAILIKEDLTFTKEKSHKKIRNKYERRMARQLNTWQKGRLNDRLEYLADKFNIDYIDVNPAYTSQYCPNCGHHFQVRIGKHHEIVICKNCGQLNANIMAAKNIKERYYDKEITLYTSYKKVKKILDSRI